MARLKSTPLSGMWSLWMSLTPDDEPLVLADRSGWDLYALELELH